jgi:hypothetical protein
MSNTTMIKTAADFRELFSTWPNVGPTVRWADRASELYRARFHAVGPNGKTACGLTVPKPGSVAMEAWADADCGNCRATWTVR